MSPRDLLALRVRLQEYDPALPKCREVVVEERDFSPDYASEEGQAEWQMTFRHPCCRPEGHEGPCRNTRLILGWPGFSALTALLDEIERLWANADARERFLHREGDLLRASEREADDLRAEVAWLRSPILPDEVCAACGHAKHAHHDYRRGSDSRDVTKCWGGGFDRDDCASRCERFVRGEHCRKEGA